jgi:hypothetical protein
LSVWRFEIHTLEIKMTTEAVIECVTEYPILYDMTRTLYKDQKKKEEKIWDKVGEELCVMPPVPTDLRQMALTCPQE